jgi:hypothetical protein
MLNQCRMHRARSILVIVGVAAFFGVFLWTEQRQRSVLQVVAALKPDDVRSLVVYNEDWPGGEPRVVVDQAKIAALLVSLKAGERYSPAHDQQNGFERFIILKPQNIALGVYQKGEVKSAVIVKPGYWRGDQDYSTYGHLRCPNPDAWKSL